MTTAFDRLIAAALKSDDRSLQALAAAAQAERNRSVGRPPKLSPEDAMAMFIVFDGIYARRYTDEVVLGQGVDDYGKPVADPKGPDGEPIAITEPTIDSTEAIVQELMTYASCSLETARKFARKQIRMMKDNLVAELTKNGVRLNMPDATT